MSKMLVLAEKPSQARDIAKGLEDSFTRKDGYLEGSRYVITWAFGHLVQLAEPHEYDEKYRKWTLEDLPIIPSKFQYTISRDTAGQFRTIKHLIHRSDISECCICTDPGREGELIARLILMMAGNKKPVYRFWTSRALTPDVVREVFSNLRPAREFDRLYQSALARQQADWLIGINGTRAFSLKGGALLSVGRVQTAVLKILAEREMEIKNFRPEDYWIVKARFQRGTDEYEGIWIGNSDSRDLPENECGKEENSDTENLEMAEHRIKNETMAEKICRRIEGQQATVRRVVERQNRERPPLLFSLTVLQQEANRLFGFSAEKTLSIVQKLYEAHLCTYPRTESQHLNEEMAVECRSILESLARHSETTGVIVDLSRCNVSAENRRIFDSSKLTDHHALIPTGKISTDLNPDEKKVFELICRRFVAAFYPDHRYRSTMVVTVAGTDTFISRGRVMMESGWRDVYGGRDRDEILPELRDGEVVRVKRTVSEKRKTTPPPRYTDASILQAMTNAHRYVKDERLRRVLKENAGIGTPATRAQILETLRQRGYIKRSRDGRTLMVTDRGLELIRVVGNEKIADVGYTAVWEQKLEEIARGRAEDSSAFIREVVEYTKALVERAKGVSIQAAGGKTRMGKCPECGSDVYEGNKSYYCGRWKEGCNFTLWKDTLKHFGKKSIAADVVKSLLEGRTVTVRGLRSPKTGRRFNSRAKLVRDEHHGWKMLLERDPFQKKLVSK